MSNDKIQDVINKFVQEIKELYGNSIDRIYLFGSCARGQQNDYSDIDILVLLNVPDEEIPAIRRNMRKSVNDIDWEYDVIVSPVYQSLKNFEVFKEASGFYQNVLKEGLLVG